MLLDAGESPFAKIALMFKPGNKIVYELETIVLSLCVR